MRDGRSDRRGLRAIVQVLLHEEAVVGILNALFGKSSRKRSSIVDADALLEAGHPADILRAAQELELQQRWPEAHALLSAASERFPEEKSIARQARRAELEVVRCAIESHVGSLERDPSVELRAALSELHRRSGDRTEALDAGRLAIEEDRNSALGYRATGRIYFDQFRDSQNSIDGMNALRHLTKAQSLDPHNSICLLQLAEIFIILEAPGAAARFLAPVERAFSDDPWVQDLAARVSELPVEETTHIQDLFLRHERRQRGEDPDAPPEEHAVVPESLAQTLQECADGVAGTRGIYVVDGTRSIAAGHGPREWDRTELGTAFGMLAETARLNSERMGIGEFSKLVVKGPQTLHVVEAMHGGLTTFYLGSEAVRISDAESVLERITGELRRSVVSEQR